ncbi:MAG: hypothetical protein Q7T89_16080 [Anaerolineales bacterium]|nr:hypothetical protein [Anaerolineales bacterium]
MTLFAAEVETAAIHAQKIKNLATKTTKETPEIFTKVFLVVLLFCEFRLKKNFQTRFRDCFLKPFLDTDDTDFTDASRTEKPFKNPCLSVQSVKSVYKRFVAQNQEG